jgi:hypothetical protein
MVNGVDVSNVTHGFTEDEWNKLPVSCQDWIHAQCRKVHAATGGADKQNTSSAHTEKNKSDGKGKEEDKASDSHGNLFGHALYEKK